MPQKSRRILISKFASCFDTRMSYKDADRFNRLVEKDYLEAEDGSYTYLA